MDWTNAEKLALQPCRATMVYDDDMGEIVIAQRRDEPAGTSQEMIFIPRDRLKAFIDALKRYLPEE